MQPGSGSVGQPWLTFERCVVQARTPGHTRIRITRQSSRLYVALGIGRQKTLVAGTSIRLVKKTDYFVIGELFLIDKKVHRDVSTFSGDNTSHFLFPWPSISSILIILKFFRRILISRGHEAISRFTATGLNTVSSEGSTP